jgi:hypothetical protein
VSLISGDGLTDFSWRTKELGEKAFLKENPESTIIRPSIIFGPGDSFFNVRPAGSQSSSFILRSVSEEHG